MNLKYCKNSYCRSQKLRACQPSKKHGLVTPEATQKSNRSVDKTGHLDRIGDYLRSFSQNGSHVRRMKCCFRRASLYLVEIEKLFSSLGDIDSLFKLLARLIAPKSFEPAVGGETRVRPAKATYCDASTQTTKRSVTFSNVPSVKTFGWKEKSFRALKYSVRLSEGSNGVRGSEHDLIGARHLLSQSTSNLSNYSMDGSFSRIETSLGKTQPATSSHADDLPDGAVNLEQDFATPIGSPVMTPVTTPNSVNTRRRKTQFFCLRESATPTTGEHIKALKQEPNEEKAAPCDVAQLDSREQRKADARTLGQPLRKNSALNSSKLSLGTPKILRERPGNLSTDEGSSSAYAAIGRLRLFESTYHTSQSDTLPAQTSMQADSMYCKSSFTELEPKESHSSTVSICRSAGPRALLRPRKNQNFAEPSLKKKLRRH